MNYLKELEIYLASQKVYETKKVVLDDGKSDLNTVVKPSESLPEVNKEKMTLSSGRFIGKKEKDPVYKLKAEEVEDRRTRKKGLEDLFIWNKEKGCYIRRK